MSHFCVLVCLPGATPREDLLDVIGARMERWNEDREVEPYRNYEEGSAEDFWWAKSIRRNAEHYRNGTGIKPYDQDGPTVSSESSRKPPDDQRAHLAWGALLAGRLDEPATWETVVTLYRERYGDGDDDRLHYDGDTDRAYTMSTYNPDSKWDYWRIGGRGRDRFVAKQESPLLVHSKRDWDSPKATHVRQRRCDGGPIRLLDFEAMRREAEKKANARYTDWETVAAKHPTARGWDHFVGLVEAKSIDIGGARRTYGDQPLIAEWRTRDEWGDCPVQEFMPPREEYVARARAAAVPGYALVTLDEEWLAPGRMGWFGGSSDGPGEREAYHVAANKYLETVNPDIILVALDCHI
jgi:hypothetical protein